MRPLQDQDSSLCFSAQENDVRNQIWLRSLENNSCDKNKLWRGRRRCTRLQKTASAMICDCRLPPRQTKRRQSRFPPPKGMIPLSHTTIIPSQLPRLYGTIEMILENARIRCDDREDDEVVGTRCGESWMAGGCWKMRWGEGQKRTPEGLKGKWVASADKWVSRVRLVHIGKGTTSIYLGTYRYLFTQTQSTGPWYLPSNHLNVQSHNGDVLSPRSESLISGIILSQPKTNPKIHHWCSFKTEEGWVFSQRGHKTPFNF